MFIIWSLHLLVPINLSRNYKLTPGPAVLFNNSAKLHLRSLAGERFADVKEIDPILKCWRNLLKLNPQGFLKYLMRMKNSLGIERPKFGQFQLFPRVTSSSLISQSSLLNAFKLPSPMLETCQHNTCHRNIKRSGFCKPRKDICMIWNVWHVLKWQISRFVRKEWFWE